MGVRISAGASLAKSPRYTPHATLQPQPGANLSAAPSYGNYSSCSACMQPACGPEGPRGCAAPSATPHSLHTAHPWPGVHREPLLLPRAASELGGLCPHWCADSRGTPTTPAVTARFLPTLQSPPYTPDTLQSSPPANSSASWWRDHSFPNGV